MARAEVPVIVIEASGAIHVFPRCLYRGSRTLSLNKDVTSLPIDFRVLPSNDANRTSYKLYLP